MLAGGTNETQSHVTAEHGPARRAVIFQNSTHEKRTSADDAEKRRPENKNGGGRKSPTDAKGKKERKQLTQQKDCLIP
jgi:hypothetical protein